MLTQEQMTANKQEFINIVRTYIKRPGIEDLLAWLERTDFYIAPASTKFHSAYAGGLVEHSLAVFKAAMQIHMQMNGQLAHPSKHIENISMESIAICSLFHDLCKVNHYQVVPNWRKDKGGNWLQVLEYKTHDTRFLGHGEDSLDLLRDYIRMSQEEKCAVRWHMGFSDPGTYVSPYDKPSYFGACHEFPLVTVIAMADVYASFVMEPRHNS